MSGIRRKNGSDMTAVTKVARKPPDSTPQSESHKNLNLVLLNGPLRSCGAAMTFQNNLLQDDPADGQASPSTITPSRQSANDSLGCVLEDEQWVVVSHCDDDPAMASAVHDQQMSMIARRSENVSEQVQTPMSQDFQRHHDQILRGETDSGYQDGEVSYREVDEAQIYRAISIHRPPCAPDFNTSPEEVDSQLAKLHAIDAEGLRDSCIEMRAKELLKTLSKAEMMTIAEDMEMSLKTALRGADIDPIVFHVREVAVKEFRNWRVRCFLGTPLYPIRQDDKWIDEHATGLAGQLTQEEVASIVEGMDSSLKAFLAEKNIDLITYHVRTLAVKELRRLQPNALNEGPPELTAEDYYWVRTRGYEFFQRRSQEEVRTIVDMMPMHVRNDLAQKRIDPVIFHLWMLAMKQFRVLQAGALV